MTYAAQGFCPVPTAPIVYSFREPPAEPVIKLVNETPQYSARVANPPKRRERSTSGTTKTATKRQRTWRDLMEAHGDDIVTRYRSGEFVRPIAEDYDVDRKVITRLLQEAGVELRNDAGLGGSAEPISLDVDELKRLRAQGRTRKEIAAQFGVSEQTIARRLTSAGAGNQTHQIVKRVRAEHGDEIKRRYEAGERIQPLADEFGVHRRTMDRLLESLGAEKRWDNGRRLNPVRVDTEEARRLIAGGATILEAAEQNGAEPGDAAAQAAGGVVTCYLAPYSRRNATMTALNDVSLASAFAIAARHTSSGTLTFRRGVGMSGGHDAALGTGRSARHGVRVMREVDESVPTLRGLGDRGQCGRDQSGQRGRRADLRGVGLADLAVALDAGHVALRGGRCRSGACRSRDRFRVLSSDVVPVVARGEGDENVIGRAAGRAHHVDLTKILLRKQRNLGRRVGRYSHGALPGVLGGCCRYRMTPVGTYVKGAA